MIYQGARLVRSLPPLLTLMAGLALTALLSAWIYRYEQQVADLAFAQRAQARMAVIRHGLEEAMEALEGINRLFVTVDAVSEAQFHQFTAPVLARYPYIYGLAFQRIVPLTQRPAYEAERRKRNPAFTITEAAHGQVVPAGVRPHYRVVHYMEPRQGNESVLGLDVDSYDRYISQQETARQRTVDTGAVSATGTYRLIQEPGNQIGFSAMMAVYRHGAPLDTIEARRQAVIGYTTAVFRAGDLVEKIFMAANLLEIAGVDTRVYASAAPDEHYLVFQKANPPAHAGSRLIEQWLPRNRPADRSQTFDVAGRPWHMVVSAGPAPFTATHPGSLVALIAGVLFSVTTTLYMRFLIVHAQQVEQQVKSRTEELQLANDRLVVDIAAREQAEAALRKSRRQLRELQANQDELIESERKRIAREIHDDLGQTLLALRLDVALLHQRSVAHPKLHGRVGDALEQLDSAIKSARTAINALRPLILDLGLQATIEWLVEQFERRGNVVCVLDTDRGDIPVDDRTATALFRILQEALSNIRRHAQARHVWIGFYRLDGGLTLSIRDDGVGFDKAGERRRDSFGLIGIQERIAALQGTLIVDSQPGHGTTLTIFVPHPQAAHLLRPALHA